MSAQQGHSSLTSRSSGAALDLAGVLDLQPRSIHEVTPHRSLASRLPGATHTRYEIVITDQLATRPLRARGKVQESAAMLGLARLLSASPGLLIDKMAAIAMELTGAPSAGFSMLAEREDGSPYFQWMSMSGMYAHIVNGCSERHDSPCGVTLELGSTQLFQDPARAFPAFGQAEPPLREGLVVPVLDSEGQPFGTLWIAQHGHGPAFDAEDVRLVSNVCAFAGAALDSLRARDAAVAEAQQKEVEGRRRDDFILALAHELRNPLQGISTAHQVLLARGPEARDRKTLSLMHSQIRRMGSLVEDLMELGKIRLGIIDLRRERLMVSDVLAAAAEAVAASADELGITLSIRPAAPGSEVDADPARMVQVLINLMSNAIKYTPAGGKVDLCADDHPDRVEFTVSDTGIGLPPEKLEKVFALYTQVNRSTPAGAEGLGIGLALVRRLVELHGGTVRAMSEGAGCGCRFVVSLPKTR